MSTTELRRAFDEGDVVAAARLLQADRSLTTALIDTPDIEPTSPLTYVGMARFYGYAQHNRTYRPTARHLRRPRDHRPLGTSASALVVARARSGSQLSVVGHAFGEPAQ
jgi:hypothetical protein